MSAGTILYLVLIAGGILAMVAMHRGDMGGVGCCGGHGRDHDGHAQDTGQTDNADPRPSRAQAGFDPNGYGDHGTPAGKLRS